MEPAGFKKWKYGVLGLVAVSVLLLLYVALQGMSTKADRTTYQQATAVADKLDEYTTSHQTVPDSLQAAGVKDVPKTISYIKLSDTSYKFCADYKAANHNVFSTVQNDLTQVTTGGATSGSGSDSTLGGVSAAQPSQAYLIIDPNYSKGENCQTIDISAFFQPGGPLINDQSGSSSSDSSSVIVSAAGLRDSQRQTDINSVQTQLEAYFAENGYYPSYADLSSGSWDTNNMKSLDLIGLHDPSASGRGITLSKLAGPGVYQYVPLNSSGTSCESDDTTCATYTLTATLEASGETYSKSNLD